MSKLDQVLEDNFPHVKFQDLAKQAIKDLFLELIGELNNNDWRKPINSDELRQKVETL